MSGWLKEHASTLNTRRAVTRTQHEPTFCGRLRTLVHGVSPPEPERDTYGCAQEAVIVEEKPSPTSSSTNARKYRTSPRNEARVLNE